MKVDNDHMTERFCENWVMHVDIDDKVSLGLFLMLPAIQISSNGGDQSCRNSWLESQTNL